MNKHFENSNLTGVEEVTIVTILFSIFCTSFGGQTGEQIVTKIVTIVAFSRMVLFAEQAAKKLSSEGISVEVIDPRTLSPLDDKSIIESVKKTGKLLIVDEANPYCSMASEVSSVVAEKAFYALKAPIRKITSPHTPVPASPTLEAFYVPSVSQIEDLARELSNY